MKELFFFGRFPAYKEVGGVTTFTYNFSHRFNSDKLTVIDFYPADGKKVPENVRVKYILGNAFMRIFRILKFGIINEGVYFFNFSSIKSLVFLFVLPKRTCSRWFAIFHNGEQGKKYENCNFITKYIIRKAIKKIDAVGALSLSQKEFFKKIDCEDIVRVTPYIAYDSLNDNSDNRFSKSVIPKIIISGFPTNIYRLIETISILSRLENDGIQFELNLCLYGLDNDGIKKQILHDAEELKNVNIYSHLDGVEFSNLLSQMDIYIRLNSVDSFGLVVAEAIEAGVLVITTDVCERYPGANLVQVDDFDTVFKELSFILTNKKISGLMRVQKSSVAVVEYDDLLSKLQSM